MPDVLETLMKLPPLCYSVLISEPALVIAIKRGEMGYYPVGRHATADQAAAQVERLNAALTPPPTQAQRRAMEHGSCFGWDAPIADPDHWGNVPGGKAPSAAGDVP